MATITGSSTIDWAGVSLDFIDVQANFDAFATRFSDVLLEIQNNQFTVDQNTATLLSMTLSSGGTVTFTGTGLDLSNPASNPIVKTFDYTDPNTGDVVSLAGTVDFVGAEVVTSLTIGFPGSEQTITGNLSVNPVSGAVSGRISQLEMTLGTTEITVKGSLVVGSNFTVSGTVREISVIDGANTITMAGLVLPYSALDSVATAADLLTLVGSQLAGSDTITYTNNSGVGMTFNGGGGNDILTINGSNGDTLDGGAGNDQLNGGAGNDTLLGQAGTDRLDGGTGDDAMDGGAGNDTYLVDSAGDTVTESLAGVAGGVDLVQSAAASVTLGENVENLTLLGGTDSSGTGNGLKNIVTGNSGNNALDGGAGTDKLVGGQGNDSYTVDLVKMGGGPKAAVKLADTITEGLNQGTDTVVLRGVVGDLVKAATLTLGANLENLDASQTGATKLNLKGNALTNVLTGNDADNVLTGLAGNDTLNGGAGHDALDGGLGQDTVNGGAGNDTITMLVTAGNVDTINAGADTDTLVLSGVVPGDHVVVANLASLTDQVVSIGGVADALAQTNFENLNAAGIGSSVNVVGSDGVNVLIGSKGNDIIDGGAGNDQLDGGLGNDELEGDEGDDTVTGGAGNDKLEGNNGNDTLIGGAGIDELEGAAGNDTLIGGVGNDKYAFGYGDGQDLIQETSGTADKLSFNRGLTVVDPEDLILSRQADNLRIALQGSTDQVMIENWFPSPSPKNRVEILEAGTGDVLLSSQVDQLIQAMNSFTAQNGGLTWEQVAAGGGTADQQTQYQNIIAAAWQ